MKLAYVTELSALISAHSHLIFEQSEPLSTTLLGNFYVHSRNRFNRWQRDLTDLENDVEIKDPLHLIGHTPVRPPIQSTTEQILINDMLNRVWTVITLSMDRFRRENRCETLITNVFRGHQTIRHKALSLCLDDRYLTSAQISYINQLSASLERWSDLLCSMLMGKYDLWACAYDKSRAQEFYQEHRGHNTSRERNQVWPFILGGLRHSFPDKNGLGAPLYEDDRQIARTILNAFPVGMENMAIWSAPTVDSAQQ